MFELDDCGNTVAAHDDTDVMVQMVIKAPRGTMVLFDRNYISPDTQCEAIIAFMEQHTVTGDPLLYHLEEHNDTKETT